MAKGQEPPSEYECTAKLTISDEDEETTCFRAFEELLLQADLHEGKHGTNECVGRRELLTFIANFTKAPG